MTVRKVLVPLDGSEFSRKILPAIPCFLAPATHQLVLLRVAPSPQGFVAGPPQPASIEWPRPMYASHRDAGFAKHPIFASQVRDSAIAALEQELRSEVLDLQQAGYRVTIAVRFGDPAAQILEFIEREGIDLVAMTTHGRTGLKRLIFGSVAETVLGRAAVPVTLLRPFEEPRPAPVPEHAARNLGSG
ncbi:MAG: universal stress protein [Anaerolineae bacterium]